MSIWSKILSAFGADGIVNGVVVATHHYPAGPPESGTVKVGAGKDQFFVETPTPVNSEAWSLTVEGIDKRGNTLKKEIYVPWDVWTEAKIGDKYP